ncbi:hypothetical protein PT974_03824 [Cladobotryum mycophilum]|uniref:DUF1993 domain-containing protein n=1 Tax=Cladobotryum mycophilum TaxID=491253 RepID=A0ABR0STR6_9HYPO
MSSSAATPSAAGKRSLYTLYDSAVPLARGSLASLKRILEKAEESPNGQGLLQERLYDDMLPLTFQIFQVTDLSTKMVARLTGKDIPLPENNIATYADAYAHIDKAQEILAQVDRDTVNNRQNEIVALGLGTSASIDIEASAYVGIWSIPNIMFHLTTSFSILRSRGIPIGKKDYMGPFLAPYYTV